MNCKNWIVVLKWTGLFCQEIGNLLRFAPSKCAVVLIIRCERLPRVKCEWAIMSPQCCSKTCHLWQENKWKLFFPRRFFFSIFQFISNFRSIQLIFPLLFRCFYRARCFGAREKQFQFSFCAFPCTMEVKFHKWCFVSLTFPFSLEEKLSIVLLLEEEKWWRWRVENCVRI